MSHSHGTDKGGHRDPSNATVFVASADLLANWSSRSAPADLLAFTDADSQSAFDTILRRRPDVVVVEQMFAATAKGEAFINQLRSDPQLAGLEIRMLSADRCAVLKALPSALGGGASLASLAHPYTGGLVRRARRIKVPAGIEVVLDGNVARLIDLSTFGAQVLSPTILRPNQTVRISIPDSGTALRVAAGIAWSALELRNAARYRAGLEFREAHPELLAALADEVEL
jgi:hypothetical protein